MPKRITAATATDQLPVPTQSIERRIYPIRGHNVMLDSDLAELYQVETRTLIQAVKRNRDRFPEDFMFQLRKDEAAFLTSQIVISKAGRGGRRYLPYVFMQEGVAMLSSVLNRDRAIKVNITIMRVFVKLREMMAIHKDLAQKIDALERKFSKHDQEIQVIFTAIKKLLQPAAPPAPQPPKRRIGFHDRTGKEQ